MKRGNSSHLRGLACLWANEALRAEHAAGLHQLWVEPGIEVDEQHLHQEALAAKTGKKAQRKGPTSDGSDGDVAA